MSLFDFIKKDYGSNSYADKYNEILSICEDIDKKLLEVETIYDNIEDDFDELDSVFLKIEEYNNIIGFIRNKESDEFNVKLLRKVKRLYSRFIKLCTNFNLLIRKDAFKRKEQENSISIGEAMAVGAVGYSIYKDRKKAREEKMKEEYRDELRNTWGLSEYEIDLVESGEYEPSQFSEEELEDDDYYEGDV